MRPDTIGIMQSRLGGAQAARIIESCLWVLVLIGISAAATASMQNTEFYRVAVAAGIASSALGIRAFVGHGGGRVTALGLFNLSSMLCVAFGAVYVGVNQASTAPPQYIVVATLVSLAAQIAITMVGWGKAQQVTLQFPAAPSTRFLTWAGLIALAFASVFRQIYYTVTTAPFIEATAFTAIAVMAVGLFWRPDVRMLSWSTLLILTLLGVYAEVFHSGQGRLRIVALACTVGVIMTARFQRKALKWVTVAAIGPALYYLAEDRKELQESLNAGASVGRTGLESMLGSIDVFAQLIQEHLERGFPLSYGYNLFSYPFAWADTLFPDAPKALGYELVKITAPSRYGSGYSVVATSNGEAYFNFGFAGLALMVPVIVYLLNLLDRKMVGSMSKSQTTALALLNIVFWAMLAGGIADLVWSGQHTFLTRATTRLPLLGFLALMVVVHLHLTRANERKPRRIPRVQSAR